MKLHAAARLLAGLSPKLVALMTDYIDDDVERAGRGLAAHANEIPREYRRVTAPLYRGQAIDGQGLKTLLDGKPLKLHKSALLSWSLDIEVGLEFCRNRVGRPTYGILVRAMPSEVDVIVNFDAVYKAGVKASDRNLMMAIEVMEQREVLTTTPAMLHSSMLGAVCLPYNNADYFNDEYHWGLKLKRGKKVTIALRPKPYVLSYD